MQDQEKQRGLEGRVENTKKKIYIRNVVTLVR